MAFRARPVPVWLMGSFGLFTVGWAAAYAWYYGPANFVWLCDLAVFMTLLGLWRPSALWLSAATCGVLLVQLGFAVDLIGRLVTGSHPIGGTEYMFDTGIPLTMRLLSLFHLLLPAVQLYALGRLGYDRRGFWLMTAIMWIALVVSYAWFASDNLNMVVRPFGHVQSAVPGWLYYLSLFAIYPLAVFGPAHLVLRRLFDAPEPVKCEAG